MARFHHWVTWGLTGCVALSGCAILPLTNPTESAQEGAGTAISDDNQAAAPTPVETTTTVANTEAETPPSEAADQAETAPQTNYFSEGVTRAESAVAIGQSAQSPDDWDLAANRWQQAMVYMQRVPESDPNYAIAQQKVEEYNQNLTLAQQRAAGEVMAAPQTAATDRPSGLVASIPVVDQMGGTPVVPVTLTGNKGSQQFTMLFDTGASGTLITPAMADAIGVVITGSAQVTVADGRQVEIPVGYVDTLRVGDLVMRDLWVGIGGNIALLGQDVYGDYGLSIGGNRIDLYE